MRTILRISAVLLLLIFFATNVNADCKTPMKIASGTTVECTGVLLSNPQFIEASNNKKELRLKDLKIAQYEGMEELYELRHSHYVDELKTAKNELKWMQFKSGVGYVISFSLGAIITGYIAKEVLK